MIHFQSDYLEGADERVLQAVVETNRWQTPGYGEDASCARARELICRMTDCPHAGVHFVVGGTQANLLVIATALRPWEGVLCAESGHIAVHETGAIEATGHKVLTVRCKDGKLAASQVEDAMQAHQADETHEHIVKPAMVYISHPTEFGTLYTRAEVTALSETCRKHGVLLFLDGARLGYGLAAGPEVDMPLLARCCDAFTIGGTKAGLLFGEAIVLTSDRLKDCFRYAMKQRGAMLAKGRLLGVQFEALLADGYYTERCACANAQAQRIKQAFLNKGFPLLCDTAANQVFPILPNAVIEELRKKYGFAFWEKVDEENTAVRFCTSVTTQEASVRSLEKDIAECGVRIV